MGQIQQESNAVGSLVFIAVIICILIYFNTNIFTFRKDLYMCPEPINLSDCSIKQSGSTMQWQDCLFTNKSGVMVDPSVFLVWNYDKDNIFIETTNIQSSVRVPPNVTTHIEVIVLGDAKKSIICSMDPRSINVTKVD